MANKPLLVFPVPERLEPTHRRGGPSHFRVPSHQRQIERVTPRLERLREAFDARRAELRDNPLGIAPEKVLVFETIGSVASFVGAVRRTGMEWLFEWTEEDIEPDDDFAFDERPEKPLKGQLYLVLSDNHAMQQFIGLWENWQQNPDIKFPFGLNAWRTLFRQLKDIRYWDTEDRLLGTGVLEYWNERLAAEDEIVRFEVELWHRKNGQRRSTAEEVVRELIHELDGQVLHISHIEQIAYHALLAELPIRAIPAFIGNGNNEIRLLKCDEIMYFRPAGQCVTEAPEGEAVELEKPIPSVQQEARLPPVTALLDGLPIEQHHWLENRIIIDDPDAWEDDYPASDRQHGTAMASLIIHGDCEDATSPIHRPLYVRPILKPDHGAFRTPHPEVIPTDVLEIDLVHRAVLRLFEGDEDNPPVAPTIRIINLSIGDPNQAFDRAMSAWARLLDWLSWEYQVLFIVSSGNYSNTIEIDIPRAELGTADAETIQSMVAVSISNEGHSRRLLSPSESINAITVGATHVDANLDNQFGHLIDPYTLGLVPSPINAIGLGYRRSIKPDLLMPGGRIVFESVLGGGSPNTSLRPVEYAGPPGQLVAAPGSQPGDLASSKYRCGTSNAAALASRNATLIYENVLCPLMERLEQDTLQKAHEAVLIKALLAHSASWGDISSQYRDALLTPENSRNFREYVARYLGYGATNIERVMNCTDQRVTILGWGDIQPDEAHAFYLPLPPSLAGRRIRKRFTVTLAWLSPINPAHQAYRRSALWVDFPNNTKPEDILLVDRQEGQWQMVRRGTLQHEIREGESATDYSGNDHMLVKVNCRPDAGSLDVEVPYALAVTIEVAEGLDVPVYNEIRERIRPQVPVAAR